MGGKYTSRVDGNQPAITQALRQCGALVQTTHTIGRGFPDLLCYYPAAGVLFLVELKMPGAKLTQDEIVWHDKWRDAPVYILETVDDVPQLLNTILEDAQ